MTNRSEAPGQSENIGSAPSGAVSKQVDMITESKVYALDESRLTTLSVVNTLTAFFFSAATGLASFAAGLLVNVAIQQSVPAETVRLMDIFVKILFGLAAICAMAGGFAWWKSRSELTKIQKASKVIAPPS